MNITLKRKLSGQIDVEVNESRVREIFYDLLSRPETDGVELQKVTLRNGDEALFVWRRNRRNGDFEFYSPVSGQRRHPVWTIGTPLPFKY